MLTQQFLHEELKNHDPSHSIDLFDSFTGDGIDSSVHLDKKTAVAEIFVVSDRWLLIFDVGRAAVGQVRTVDRSWTGGIDGDTGETDALIGAIVGGEH